MRMFLLVLVLAVAEILFFSWGIRDICISAVRGEIISNTIFVALLLGSLCALGLHVVYIIFFYKLTKAFGMKVEFLIGLIFLPLIFLCILAFGKAQYVRNKQEGNQQPLIE